MNFRPLFLPIPWEGVDLDKVSLLKRLAFARPSEGSSLKRTEAPCSLPYRLIVEWITLPYDPWERLLMSFRTLALPIPKERVDLDKVPPSREACARASFQGEFTRALKLLALYLTGSTSTR